jgi:hypothetical protein
VGQEDRVRELCSKAIAALEPAEREAVLTELRAILHEEKSYVRSLIAAHRQLFRVPPGEPLSRKPDLPARSRAKLPEQSINIPSKTVPIANAATPAVNMPAAVMTLDTQLRQLCERASKEQDSWKLLELAQEINRLIDQKQKDRNLRAG